MRAFYLIQIANDPKLATIAYDIKLCQFDLSNQHFYYVTYHNRIPAALVDPSLKKSILLKKGTIVMHMGYFASYGGIPRHLIFMHEGALFMTNERGHDLESIRYLEKT